MYKNNPQHLSVIRVAERNGKPPSGTAGWGLFNVNHGFGDMLTFK